MYMLISIVSLLEDGVTRSLLLLMVIYQEYVYMQSLNDKAHKESKSSFVSIYCEIKIVVLALYVCIQ